MSNVSVSSAAACTVIPSRFPLSRPGYSLSPDLSPSPLPIIIHGRRQVCRPRSSSVRHSSHRIQFYNHKKGTQYPVGRSPSLPSITQGLNEAGDRAGHTYSQASDDHAYLKNPVWWAGMSISERCHTCVLHPLIRV